MKKNEKATMIIILVGFIIGVFLDFLLTTGVIAIICWAFNLTFSWKIAIGIYAIIALLHSIFATVRNVNN